MKSRWITSAFFASVVFCSSVQSQETDIEVIKKGAKAQITFQVVDLDGHAVTNANVFAGFYNPKKRDNRSEGLTDTNGMFTATGTSVQDMTFRVTKDGYYETRGHYLFLGKVQPSVVDGRWQPWNPTWPVVLKRKINPIPMYARSVKAGIPLYGKPVGYDLVKSDWVAPHGKGEKADMLFTAKGTFASRFDRRVFMTIDFPNEHDGIQEFVRDNQTDTHGVSEFISPYLAPEDGYQRQWSFEKRISPTRGESINTKPREDLHFMYRIRTEVDKEGKIVSALYGKIYGDIHCYFWDFNNPKALGVCFRYYLNLESNDRNIEFDPEQNLYKTSLRNREGWLP